MRRARAAHGDVHRHRRLDRARRRARRRSLARPTRRARRRPAQRARRFGGREVKTVGDGFLATFDGPPSRALRCALAISARDAGPEIDVRVGMHMGECELIGEDVAGMAVHIAARVNGLADPGEVLVSGTVFGTVVGGPFSFASRGSHALKGVPGQWPIFALVCDVARLPISTRAPRGPQTRSRPSRHPDAQAPRSRRDRWRWRFLAFPCPFTPPSNYLHAQRQRAILTKLS